MRTAFNPFMPNRISHRYQLNSPFLFEGMLGSIFHFVASDLGLQCLHKKDARHTWVKIQLFCYLIRVPEIWEVDC